MLEIQGLGGQTSEYIGQSSNQNDCYFQSMYTPTCHTNFKGLNYKIKPFLRFWDIFHVHPFHLQFLLIP